MNFEWSNNDIATSTVTLYSTNLTLNKAACKHFEDIQYVLLGLDKSSNTLGIKPVNKQQLDAQLFPREQLHRISIGKSYGRISNKSFITMVISQYNLEVDNTLGIKFLASYDAIHEVLTIKL